MARPATGQVVVRKRKGGKTFGLRFRAYGKRRYLSLGSVEEGWSQRRAEEELANVLADVRRGIWKAARTDEAGDETPEPTFHEFASEWLASRRHEFAARTVEDYELALTHHLLPFFKDHRLSEITAHEADRYKAAKVREREQGQVKRPLSNRTINKTLTRLGQILDTAVRSDLLDHNPVKAKVEKLRETEPKRARLTGDQVQVLLRAAGEHRALIATAIMAGGLRVSELTHLRWHDVDLREGLLNVAASKTAAGVRQVVLDPEWSSFCGNTSSPPSGVSQTTSFSPVAFASSRASATASALASFTAPSKRRTSCLRPKTARRCRTASRSTRCVGPTRRCAPSLASIPRSPPRRWATATRV